MKIRPSILMCLLLYNGALITEEQFTSKEDHNITPQALSELVATVVKEIEKKSNLKCIVEGNSIYIEELDLLLTPEKPKTIEEDRKLLVRSTEEQEIMGQAINEVITTLAERVGKEFNLKYSGLGGNALYDIEEIYVFFIRHEPATIQEARELLIRTTEEFVKIINSHEAIRPYLKDYPWDYKRAEVSISIIDEQDRRFPEVGLVFEGRGNVVYYGPETPTDGTDEAMKREPYLEAKKIVETGPSVLKPIEKKKKKWFNWI